MFSWKWTPRTTRTTVMSTAENLVVAIGIALQGDMDLNFFSRYIWLIFLDANTSSTARPSHLVITKPADKWGVQQLRKPQQGVGVNGA